jgi:hypothetical protein
LPLQPRFNGKNSQITTSYQVDESVKHGYSKKKGDLSPFYQVRGPNSLGRGYNGKRGALNPDFQREKYKMFAGNRLFQPFFSRYNPRISTETPLQSGFTKSEAQTPQEGVTTEKRGAQSPDFQRLFFIFLAGNLQSQSLFFH